MASMVMSSVSGIKYIADAVVKDSLEVPLLMEHKYYLWYAGALLLANRSGGPMTERHAASAREGLEAACKSQYYRVGRGSVSKWFSPLVSIVRYYGVASLSSDAKLVADFINEGYLDKVVTTDWKKTIGVIDDHSLMSEFLSNAIGQEKAEALRNCYTIENKIDACSLQNQ